MSGTFNSCIELREIEIPENITYIGHNAFNNCQSLLKVTILNQNVTIRNDITYNDKTTFNNGLDETGSSFFAGTIYGYNNSTAQAFAERNSYKFESLGDPLRDLGDVNGDKAVDSSDAALILKEYATVQGGNEASFSEADIEVADFNNDTLIDSSDAALILKAYAENQAK